jgi:hypothetical protein
MELRAALLARREQLQPDALPKVGFLFLGRAVVVVRRTVVAVDRRGAELQERRPSVQQVQLGE